MKGKGRTNEIEEDERDWANRAWEMRPQGSEAEDWRQWMRARTRRARARPTAPLAFCLRMLAPIARFGGEADPNHT